MLFFKNKKLVGIDIGSTSIKIAELESKGKSWVLTAFSIIPTPNNSYNNGGILEPAEVAKSISDILGAMGTKRNKASFGLSGSSVVVKKISMPKMDEKLLSEQIRWEAEQYIPYDINEVNVDFKIIGKPKPTDDVMDVLVIAAVKEYIFKFIETSHLIPIECALLDVSSFSLANCFLNNYQSIGVNCLLNIGAQITNISILENNEVVYCRDMAFAGSNYTSDLQSSMGVSFEEAEALKIAASNGEQAPNEVGQYLATTHEAFVEELDEVLQFYVNSKGGGAVSNLFVTGGGSKVLGLKEKMAERWNIEELNPFMELKTKGQHFSPAYLNKIKDLSSVALGLGMRLSGDSK